MADLVTLEQYKTYMSIASTSQDDRHNDLIARASTIVEEYCEKTFISSGTPAAQYFWGTYDEVYTDGFPATISSLEVVEEFDATTGAPVYALWVENDNTDNNGYWVEAEDGRITTMSGAPFFTGKYNRAVRVMYTSGAVDVTGVPADLQQAVLDIVKMYDKHETTVRVSNMNHSMDNSFNPTELARTWPPHILRILNRHRNIVTLGG